MLESELGYHWECCFRGYLYKDGLKHKELFFNQLFYFASLIIIFNKFVNFPMLVVVFVQTLLSDLLSVSDPLLKYRDWLFENSDDLHCRYFGSASGDFFLSEINDCFVKLN